MAAWQYMGKTKRAVRTEHTMWATYMHQFRVKHTAECLRKQFSYIAGLGRTWNSAISWYLPLSQQHFHGI